ncbi:MAG: carboxypeptidase regulatory-like domain-containing protein [Bacteroidota bacterium]
MPFAAQISPDIKEISWIMNRGKDRSIWANHIEIPDARTLVLPFAYRIHDSAFFEIESPEGLPVLMELWRNDRLFFSSQLSRSWDTALLAKQNEHFRLLVQVPWKSEIHEMERILPVFDEYLQVEVEQPFQAQPGEALDVLVTVKDARGNPVRGVDLTSLAVNARFEDSNVPDLPYTGKHIRTRQRKPFSDLNTVSLGSGPNLRLDSTAVENFGVMELPFYQLIRTDSIMAYYWKGEKEEVAQFAPYIYHNGEQEKIHMIYLNGQLVYYSGANTYPSYAFCGPEGKSFLRLRTKDREYTVRDIELKKGQKLEVVINPTYTSSLLTWEEKPQTFTYQERNLINRRFISLQADSRRKSPFYAWQGNQTFLVNPNRTRRYHYRGPYTDLIGPLWKDKVACAVPNEFTRMITWRPGFLHKVDTRSVQLHDAEKIVDEETEVESLNAFRISQPFGQEVVLPQDLDLAPSEPPKTNPMGFNTETDASGDLLFLMNWYFFRGGGAVMSRASDTTNMWAFSGEQKLNLPIDEYRLVFISSSSEVLRTIYLEIKKDSLLALPFLIRTYPDSFPLVNHGWKPGYYPKAGKFMNQVMHEPRYLRTFRIADSIGNPVQGVEMVHFFKGLLVQGGFSDENGEVTFGSTFPWGKDSGAHTCLLLHKDYKPQRISIFTDSLVQEVRLKAFREEEAHLQSTIQAGLIRDQTFSFLKDKAGNKVIRMRYVRDDLNPFELDSVFLEPITVSREMELLFGDTLTLARKRAEGKFPDLSVPEYLRRSYLNQISGGTDEISGQVFDENGNPLVGAVVMVTDTVTNNLFGAYTDEEGFFRIKVTGAKLKLEVRYIGYNSATKLVLPGSYVRVTLAEKSLGLVEVEIVASRKQPLYVSAAASEVQSRRRVQVSLPRFGFGYRKRRFKRKGPFHWVNSLQNKYANTTLADSVQSEDDEEADFDTPLRETFRDYAWWQPDLLTDSLGQVRITVRVPDDLTGWNTHVLAVGPDGKTGQQQGFLKVFRQLSARLSVPRFLIEGDSSSLIGRVIRYDAQDSLDITTRFRENGIAVLTGTHPIKTYFTEEQEIIAPSLAAQQETDTLTFSYELATGKIQDGEKHKVPVFKRGVKQAEGGFAYLEGDTSWRFEPDPQLGPVHVAVAPDGLTLLMDDLKRLAGYDHDCNEQMSSKLNALAMLKEVETTMGKPFSRQKDANKLIRKLRRNQNQDGSWGWWADNPGSLWMTTYATQALHKWYPKGRAVKLGKAYLQDSLAEEYNHYGRTRKLKTLLTLKEMDILADTGYFFAQLRLDTIPLSNYEWLLATRLHQLLALPPSVDSLINRSNKTASGGRYWGSTGWRWYGGEVEMTALAYEMLRDMGGQEAHLREIRNHWFERRASGDWGNTVESARILATLAPELLNGSGEALTPKVQLTQGQKSFVVPSFPHRQTLTPESLAVKKLGPGPLFISAWQEQWNGDPTPVDSLFSIKTRLIQDGKKVEVLKAGTPAVLEVTLDMKKAGSYLALEVPIPAGCSYGPKKQFGAYTEYRKQAATLYFQQLDPGEYTFKIKLEPKFTGTYHLNPAKIEQMYLPVKFGRNSVRKVKVGK